MDNCLHLRRGQIHLRHRPWHYKFRFNLGDHLVSGYAAGESFPFGLLLHRSSSLGTVHHMPGRRSLHWIGSCRALWVHRGASLSGSQWALTAG